MKCGEPAAEVLKSHGLIYTDWADGPTDGLGMIVSVW